MIFVDERNDKIYSTGSDMLSIIGIFNKYYWSF